MKHLNKFSEYLISEKIYFYDKNGVWFSTSKTTKGIEEHKNRFGDDITFSVDNIDKRFNTLEEYTDYVKNKKPSFGNVYNTVDEIEAAKERVKEKRLKKLKRWWE